MQNIDKVNVNALKAFEAGNEFLVLIVVCKKTGGRFVSVRSVTPYAFDTGLRACAKDKNFGAYNSPILESFRKYGSDGHSISLHGSYKTRKLANLAKKLLVEDNALKSDPKVLNYNRPVKNMPVSDFYWKSEDELKEMAKAKRARGAKKQPIAEQPIA